MSLKIKERAIFLDRDGTINHMVAYSGSEPYDSPQRPEDITIVDGIKEIISWAKRNNLLVVEITNQPGVAKGKMSQETADNIQATIHSQIPPLDKIFICPHLSSDNCICRKPKPGLLIQAATELNIDLTRSIFIGDGAVDVLAGQAVGCKTIILLHNNNLPAKVEEAKNAPADYRVTSFSEVIPILENFFSPSPISQ